MNELTIELLKQVDFRENKDCVISFSLDGENYPNVPLKNLVKLLNGIRVMYIKNGGDTVDDATFLNLDDSFEVTVQDVIYKEVLGL